MRPAYHVVISTYKVALPASSKYNLIVPKCGLDDQIMQNEGKICSSITSLRYFFSKGKKLLITERRIKFIANILKVSLS